MPVDRPGAIVCVRSLDTAVRIEISGPRALEYRQQIERAWSACLADPGTDVSVLRVSSNPDDSEADIASDDLDLVMHLLSQEVTLAVIGAQAGQFMMFHAVGLADLETGATAVFVAPSGTGKTTLARSATAFGYVSDETVGIRSDLSVVAHPKPLSILHQGPYKQQLSPVQLGLAPAPSRLHALAFALLRRSDDGPEEPRVELVPTLEALALLAPQASYLARFEQPLHVMADLVEQTGGLRLIHYRSTVDVIPLVRPLLEGSL